MFLFAQLHVLTSLVSSLVLWRSLLSRQLVSVHLLAAVNWHVSNPLWYSLMCLICVGAQWLRCRLRVAGLFDAVCTQMDYWTLNMNHTETPFLPLFVPVDALKYKLEFPFCSSFNAWLSFTLVWSPRWASPPWATATWFPSPTWAAAWPSAASPLGSSSMACPSPFSSTSFPTTTPSWRNRSTATPTRSAPSRSGGAWSASTTHAANPSWSRRTPTTRSITGPRWGTPSPMARTERSRRPVSPANREQPCQSWLQLPPLSPAVEAAGTRGTASLLSWLMFAPTDS